MDAKIRQQTLRLISNGIYVLTARDGDHYGAATVSWVSQVSFKPPLIMAAVRRDCNVFQCLSVSHFAALHIVGDRQRDIAKQFFHPTRTGSGTINGEPFEDGLTQAPVLRNLPAHVECEVDRIFDTEGDHAVVILRVVEAQCAATVRPLTMAETSWQYGG